MSDDPRSRPAAVGNEASSNTAPIAQASVQGDRLGLIALILGILALLFAIYVVVTVSAFRSDLDNIRGLIENSANAATNAQVDAARSADRAYQAQQSAALAREYAVQVFPQLNRMGYPVKSPGEPEHPTAQPQDYEAVDNYIERRQAQ